MTNFGERPIQYDFGANLRTIIFEQGPGIIAKAKDLITIAVNKWMPFVILDNIQVDTEDTDDTVMPNQIKISISFSVGQLTGKLDQTISA